MLWCVTLNLCPWLTEWYDKVPSAVKIWNSEQIVSQKNKYSLYPDVDFN